MSGDASRLPQTIAHRGYKGHYPENTIYAIDKAIAAGTHALELDLHISRDGVIVLSHVSVAVSSRPVRRMLIIDRMHCYNAALALRRRFSNATGTIYRLFVQSKLRMSRCPD